MKLTLLFTELQSCCRLFFLIEIYKNEYQNVISKKHHFSTVMFCKSINSARARLARVSARLGPFFYENENLFSASKTKIIGIIYITSVYIHELYENIGKLT